MLKRSDKTKPPHGSQTHRLVSTFVVVTTLLLLATLFFSLAEKNQPKQIIKHVSPSHHPTVEIQNGTQLIWKLPKTKPKAVLFIAHGCHRKATDFWDKSPSCPQCTSLPEEKVLVRTALSKTFAVITISSSGTCWTLGKERKIVRDVIKTWLKRQNLEKVPLVALGASSGGYFVSALAMDMNFRSIVVMIAEGVFDQIRVSRNYPATLFVHMPKDVYRQRKIREFLEGLRMEGVDVKEVECFDLEMSPGFLADRIPGFDRGVSEKIFEVFREKGFVDEKGFMKRDGRRTPWKEALSGYEISLDESLVTPVEEELNLAFAYHEMTSVESEQIFNWFESHMG
ncbi:unnamed protein product [Eruca vesicaria subsp. sativa]|uniref:Uncharacterized protein n=1 Tax=Eruca vesicaria subsp. sativa TaxID=29727 RepID=A0ABC8KLF2_ERUVS|nr:unnamed protein product [Eruca vesicaria subsp. sativa]